MGKLLNDLTSASHNFPAIQTTISRPRFLPFVHHMNECRLSSNLQQKRTFRIRQQSCQTGLSGHDNIADISCPAYYSKMMSKLPLLIAVAVALNSCDGTDTRAKRLAAIAEVERACHLPEGSIGSMSANEPASRGQGCDSVTKQCRDTKFIHLGIAYSKPLLCHISCIKNYKSRDGYEFGLYLRGVTAKDAPKPINCPSSS